MVNPAAARRRLSRAAARAVSIAHRRRRDSHRGYPDLFQTHRVAVGGSIDVPTYFPTPAREVTFKFRLNRSDPAATGVLVTLGDQGSIELQSGALLVNQNGEEFVGSFPGAPASSAEVVVALKPVEGKVRAWADSDCVISGVTSSFPYSWATSGSIAYDSIAGADVVSELDAFDLQLPRHFDECGDVTTPAAESDDHLYRAAIAANLATRFVPFLGEH